MIKFHGPVGPLCSFLSACRSKSFPENLEREAESVLFSADINLFLRRYCNEFFQKSPNIFFHETSYEVLENKKEWKMKEVANFSFTSQAENEVFIRLRKTLSFPIYLRISNLHNLQFSQKSYQYTTEYRIFGHFRPNMPNIKNYVKTGEKRQYSVKND